MATITVAALLGASPEKGESLNFEDITDLIANATPAQLAILAAQVPTLATLITAVGAALDAYTLLVDTTVLAQETFDTAQALLIPAATPMLVAKVAQGVGAEVIDTSKAEVKDVVLNTTVTVP